MKFSFNFFLIKFYNQLCNFLNPGITFSTQHEVTNTAVESPQVDRPVDPNGKHCDWPEVWWPTPRPGRCDCFNRDLKKDCTYPANWVPYSPNVKKSCLCNCPWWAHLVCADNQYLDRGDCKCKCRDPCQDEDCTRPQVWNNHTCQCECQYPVGCVEPRYYNHWTCNCECIQKPRLCCPRLTPLKIWNERVRIFYFSINSVVSSDLKMLVKFFCIFNQL